MMIPEDATEMAIVRAASPGVVILGIASSFHAGHSFVMMQGTGIGNSRLAQQGRSG